MPLKEVYFENEYYTYNFRFFKLIGLWYYETSLKYLIYVCFLNFIIAFGSFLQIYLLLTSELKVDPIIKLMRTFLPCLCYASCFYNLLLNAAIMKKILYSIKCDWDKLANKPELIILKRYASRSKLCTITIAISFYLYITFLMLPSVVCILPHVFGVVNGTELALPIRNNYFLKDQMHYYLTFFFECTLLTVICTIGIAYCSMFVSTIQHACALFDIVTWMIEKRFKNNQHNFYRDYTRKFAQEYEWIIGIIEFYDNAINFVDLIMLFYGKIFLFSVSFWVFFIIVDYLYLFQLLSFNLDKTEGLTIFSFIFATIFIIYVYCYLGQKLIDHHTEVFAKFCQIPFYSLSLKTQKILLFLILKSMKSYNLSVKGIIVISHYLFATLMRTSFSYAMIFYKLR